MMYEKQFLNYFDGTFKIVNYNVQSISKKRAVHTNNPVE